MIVAGHEAFLLTLLFGVTGYITHSMAARFTFRRSERPELLLLRFLAYGTLNALISLPLIAMRTKVLPKETWASILVHNFGTYYELAVWTLFLIPAILGIVLGGFHALYGLQDWFKAPVASWDERIARNRHQWVLVSLEDGTKVAGYLGREAAVVSDTGERDLYLQTLCQADSNGLWQKVPRSRGMLISGKSIRSMEFWEDEFVKPMDIRARLSAWANPKRGCVTPSFQSSLIASATESAKVLENVTIASVNKLPLEVTAISIPKAVIAGEAGHASNQARNGLHTISN